MQKLCQVPMLQGDGDYYKQPGRNLPQLQDEMSREIKYKAIESYGDCTTKFEVQGADGMKVGEFISSIVSVRPEDSGTFSIDGVRFPYDNKRRKLSINTDEAPCHLTIASVTAHGAYWQMDYEITTKNGRYE